MITDNSLVNVAKTPFETQAYISVIEVGISHGSLCEYCAKEKTDTATLFGILDAHVNAAS
jgi:hypothetical protein